MRSPEEILREARTIAVVGASPDSSRTSNGVMRYLQRAGYRCIPVNPNAQQVLGERCYPSLADVPEAIDFVDVFRRLPRAGFWPDLARDAAAGGAAAPWVQLGLRSPEARAIAAGAGMDYVE